MLWIFYVDLIAPLPEDFLTLQSPGGALNVVICRVSGKDAVKARYVEYGLGSWQTSLGSNILMCHVLAGEVTQPKIVLMPSLPCTAARVSGGDDSSQAPYVVSAVM
jgi:hypothetical protein